MLKVYRYLGACAKAGQAAACLLSIDMVAVLVNHHNGACSGVVICS